MSAAAAAGLPGGAFAAFTSPGSCCGGLVAALFFGILAREILMDCVDVKGDAVSGVVTVPVKYGNQ
jgi:4-hydroxybenzoate polyprenyltransferase